MASQHDSDVLCCATSDILKVRRGAPAAAAPPPAPAEAEAEERAAAGAAPAAAALGRGAHNGAATYVSTGPSSGQQASSALESTADLGEPPEGEKARGAMREEVERGHKGKLRIVSGRRQGKGRSFSRDAG